jgi:hypothetical protein
MWLLLLEALAALALLLFAVWWTMFSGRRKGDPAAGAEPGREPGRDRVAGADVGPDAGPGAAAAPPAGPGAVAPPPAAGPPRADA